MAGGQALSLPYRPDSLSTSPSGHPQPSPWLGFRPLRRRRGSGTRRLLRRHPGRRGRRPPMDLERQQLKDKVNTPWIQEVGVGEPEMQPLFNSLTHLHQLDCGERRSEASLSGRSQPWGGSNPSSFAEKLENNGLLSCF